MNIQIEDLTVAYPRQGLSWLFWRRPLYPPCITGLSFTVHPGERIAIVGPNGSGKTTLLRSMCNIVPAVVQGRIVYDGKEAQGRDPSELPVRFAEGDSLYPYQDVARNIVYFLLLQGFSEDECRRRLREASAQVGIEHLLGRSVGELSSGQKQRVILARMLVSSQENSIWLFDEPLSHVDPESREELRELFLQIFEEYGVTVLYVTHERREVLDICRGSGSRVLFLRKGRIEQFAPITEVLERPATQYVRSFFAEWIKREHAIFREFNTICGGVT